MLVLKGATFEQRLLFVFQIEKKKAQTTQHQDKCVLGAVFLLAHILPTYLSIFMRRLREENEQSEQAQVGNHTGL